jgi:hypothetical protein
MAITRLSYILSVIIYKFIKVDIRPYLIKFFLYSIPYIYFKIFRNSKQLNKDIFSTLRLSEANINYKGDKDKRKLWEYYRFNFINNEIYSDVQRIDFFVTMVLSYKNFPFIVFENMMEGSLRSSNLIYFLINNQVNNFDEDFIYLSRYFIKKTVLLNSIAPDMYIKRRGLKLSDESNNHFILCMISNILSLWYLKKDTKKAIKNLNEYLEIRFSQDGFLKEGATFYSFLIVEAVLKMCFLINIKKIDFFGKNIKCAIQAFTEKKWILESCNFGDRDDTRFIPSLTHNIIFKEYCTNILKSSPYKYCSRPLHDTITHFNYESKLDIVINHRKIEDFGTLGHYHDDYGQVNIFYKGVPVIIDPGTISYANYDSVLDTCSHHNMPYVISQKSINRIAKFVKTFPASVSKKESANSVLIKSSDQYGNKNRNFLIKEIKFEDSFRLSGPSKINFYVPIKFKIKNQTKLKLTILTKNNLLISFESNYIDDISIYTSVMAGGYGKEKNIKVISFGFNNFITLNKLEWSLTTK